ncbi:uncharacterized protein LOC144905571 [Branchiostoma floridae x Branchiostoma belcheri]
MFAIAEDLSAVLLLNDRYGRNTTNRQVAQIVTGAGRKVYSAVVKVTTEDKNYAEADGVDLILPICSPEDKREPSLDWLTFDHPARYPSLPKDVGYIVGHAEVTSKAAAAIQEQRFPQANLGLVIETIPEDTEKYKEEEKAMCIGEKEDSIRQDAEKAHTVFSVGHNIFDHFTNSFSAIPENKKPTHHLFLPKPSDLFQKTTVKYRETKERVVLSIGGVNKVERVKGYDLVAKSLVKVAETSLEKILWRICDISEEEFQATMSILQACINSGKLIPTLYPRCTQEDICRHMQQAHLVLMPSRAEPFGLVGLEAMAAGVPVLISDQSGLATLVDKVIPEFHHSVLEIGGDDSVDVTRWAGQIGKVLRKSKAEFRRAAELKAKLLESRYWEESHQQLLQACGGAAGSTERTRPDHEQSSEDPRLVKLATSKPVPLPLIPTAMGKAEDIGDLRKEIKMLEEKKALLEQKAEMNKKIQQLQEAMKEMEARNEELLTAKQPVEGGSQQKDPVQTMSAQQSTDELTATVNGQTVKHVHSQTVKQSAVRPKMKDTETSVKSSAMSRMAELLTAKQPVEGGSRQKGSVQTMSDKPTATNTGQVKQSVVQTKRKVKGTSVRPIRVGQPWVRKVRFGGWGTGRGKFIGPTGVAVSQDNEVYIADHSRIQVFTMDGVFIREVTTTLPGETGEKLKPHDVAVDRNDNLWVVGEKHVVQYSREGTCLAKIGLPGSKRFFGLTVAMATEQVIVTECDGRLRVFNQDGSKVGTYGSGHRSPKPWWPRYVTVDGEGNILVTDNNNHCVHVWDREGNFKFKFGSEGSDQSQLKNPHGICVDGKGNIIVVDRGNGCVKMFDSQGRFLCHIGSIMMGPWGVTVSPGGDVVVTDWTDNTVSVWRQARDAAMIQAGRQGNSFVFRKEFDVTCQTEWYQIGKCVSNMSAEEYSHCAVLLLNDQYGRNTTNRQVAQIVTGAGRKVYSTVLEETEEDKKCAEADGVKLILPTRSQGDTREPSLDWLTFDHPGRYPSLPEDVRCIVGHAEVTSKAAAAIQEQRFPHANLGLVIEIIPEDTEKYKDDKKAMDIGKKEDSIRQDAEKADVVFSVGHNIFNRFTNSFSAIPENKKPTHLLFLPKPSDLFQKTTVKYRETDERVVLSIGGVNKVERVKGYDLVAKSLVKVVETSLEKILWRICDISEEDFQATMSILQASINSGKLTPTLLPQCTQEDICRHMQQAHLVLMPSRAEPFGLVGLEAMAAGVPVLISDQSGLATLVKKVIPEFHHSVLEIEGDDSVDVGRWASQIKKVLRMSEAEFRRAAELKVKLLESRYWEESHQQLLQAFGGAAGNIERTRPDHDQSLEESRPARLATRQTDLPVHLNLGVQPPTARGQAGDIDARISKRLLKLERTLFTKEVLRDRRRYKKTVKLFQKHKALLKEAVKGSFILLLTFLRQTDVDRFYHNHYRVGEGTLSQQLSPILISDDLQDKVKGAQLIVRLHVKHEDYVRVRDRLGKGLDRTTSAENLLPLPPSRSLVDHSSLKGMDLAVIGQEDQPCRDRTDDITMPYRQVQSAVQIAKEKSKREVEVQLETMQGQVETGRSGVDAMMREVKMLREKNEKAEKAEKVLLEQKTETNKKIRQLQETNKSLEATIEELLIAKKRWQVGAKKILLEQETQMNEKMKQLQETIKKMEARNEALLTAKQTVEGGSQQKDPGPVTVQHMSDQQSTDEPKATVQVKQSAVRPKRKDTETSAMSSVMYTLKELLTAKQPVEGGSQQKSQVQTTSDQQSMDKPTATGQVKQSVVQPKMKDTETSVKSSAKSRRAKLLTAKQPVEGGSLQIYPVQTLSGQHYMDRPKATNTGSGRVRQSVVQPKRKVKGTKVRPIRVGQPWVRKVRFGGWGSGRGKIKGPYGVAVSQDNEVYIADCSNSRIQVFTMDGVYIREFTTTLPGETGEKLKPHDVAVDRNDNLWVVGGDHVVQYSREGTCLATIDLPHVAWVRGITVSMATEQVIVTEYDGQNGRLRVFNQDGSEVGTYGAGHRSPEPWRPRCVTVDGEGNILVTDNNNQCVHVLDREGNFKFKFGSWGSDESHVNDPLGICVDGKGNIIVADSGNGCVKMFDSQGRFLCYIGSGMEDPTAVTVSPGGDVVVTDWEDNTVSVWTQD